MMMAFRRLGIRILLGLCGLLGVVSTAVAASPGDGLLRAFFDDLKTLSADFDQRVVDADGTQVQHVSGHMWLQRPGRFRWDYQQPYHQLIVGDGKQVWVYDEDLEQVTVRPVDKTLGQTPALLLSSDKPLLDAFSATVLGRRDGIDWVLLQPQDADATFDELRLGLVDGRLRAMELRDGLGHTTTLRFSNLRRNRPIDPQQFVFVPPAGVDVVRDVISAPGAQE